MFFLIARLYALHHLRILWIVFFKFIFIFAYNTHFLQMKRNLNLRNFKFYVSVCTGHITFYSSIASFRLASTTFRCQDNTQTHHIRQDFTGRVIDPSQRASLDNTRNRHSCIRPYSNLHSQQASDCRPTLRLCGHWDRPSKLNIDKIN